MTDIRRLEQVVEESQDSLALAWEMSALRCRTQGAGSCSRLLTEPRIPTRLPSAPTGVSWRVVACRTIPSSYGTQRAGSCSKP